MEWGFEEKLQKKVLRKIKFAIQIYKLNETSFFHVSGSEPRQQRSQDFQEEGEAVKKTLKCTKTLESLRMFGFALGAEQKNSNP